MNKTINISLPEELIKKLDKAAEKQDRKKSVIVKRALEEHFRKGKL